MLVCKECKGTYGVAKVDGKKVCDYCGGDVSEVKEKTPKIEKNVKKNKEV